MRNSKKEQLQKSKDKMMREQRQWLTNYLRTWVRIESDTDHAKWIRKDAIRYIKVVYYQVKAGIVSAGLFKVSYKVVLKKKFLTIIAYGKLNTDDIDNPVVTDIEINGLDDYKVNDNDIRLGLLIIKFLKEGLSGIIMNQNAEEPEF